MMLLVINSILHHDCLSINKIKGSNTLGKKMIIAAYHVRNFSFFLIFYDFLSIKMTLYDWLLSTIIFTDDSNFYQMFDS